MQEAYKWLYRIIESCNNHIHFEYADVLIDLFHKKYQDADLSNNLLDLRMEVFLKMLNKEPDVPKAGHKFGQYTIE